MFYYTAGNAAEKRFSTRGEVPADNGGMSWITWEDYCSWKHHQVDLAVSHSPLTEYVSEVLFM
jgi:uncharacterized protein (DUF779 family)